MLGLDRGPNRRDVFPGRLHLPALAQASQAARPANTIAQLLLLAQSSREFQPRGAVACLEDRRTEARATSARRRCLLPTVGAYLWLGEFGEHMLPLFASPDRGAFFFQTTKSCRREPTGRDRRRTGMHASFAGRDREIVPLFCQHLQGFMVARVRDLRRAEEAVGDEPVPARLVLPVSNCHHLPRESSRRLRPRGRKKSAAHRPNSTEKRCRSEPQGRRREAASSWRAPRLFSEAVSSLALRQRVGSGEAQRPGCKPRRSGPPSGATSTSRPASTWPIELSECASATAPVAKAAGPGSAPAG